MNIAELDISHRYQATVRETSRMTPPDSGVEVRHIVLEVDDPTFHFIEGQCIGVLPPGPHEFGAEHHLRLYSIASGRSGEGSQAARFSICVRRCFYIDEVSGEQYPGMASNYLCDRSPGDALTLTGPYGRHFLVPRDESANLLMIGIGTGIAPFRAFIKHVYEERGSWRGKIRLFYGAKTPLEMLYLNDVHNDLGQYYDQETFQAFQALSPRPYFDEPPAVEERLREHSLEVRELLQDPKTYVYVAGQEKMSEKLDEALSEVAGSQEKWRAAKEKLISGRRWSELLY